MMRVYTRRYAVSTRVLRRALSLFLPAILCCALLAGCGGASAPKPALESEDPGNVLWSYGEKAIRLRLNAAKDLNTFDGKAHTLQLCVYQLDKRDAFDLQKADQDGINSLLRCAAFDKSVKSATRIFLQPDETAVYSLDRAEGATFVGVACGYFDSTPEQSARLWQIPLASTQSGFLFWKSTLYSAGGLDLSLHLSAKALEENSEPEKADCK